MKNVRLERERERESERERERESERERENGADERSSRKSERDGIERKPCLILKLSVGSNSNELDM